MSKKLSTLLNLIHKKIEKIRNKSKSYSASRRAVLFCPLAFAEVGVKGRVRSVLNYKKPAFWFISIGVILCVVLAICFLTNPRKEVYEEDTNKQHSENILNRGDSLPRASYEFNHSLPAAEEIISIDIVTGGIPADARLKSITGRDDIEMLRKMLSEVAIIRKAEPEEFLVYGGIGHHIVLRLKSEEVFYCELVHSEVLKWDDVNYIVDCGDLYDFYKIENDLWSQLDYQEVYIGESGLKALIDSGGRYSYDDETKADNQGNEKYAAVYKEKISPEDYETIISLCQDTFSEYVDAIRKEELPELSSYIENDLLVQWIEYRTTDFHYGYSSSEEYQIFVDEVEVYDNYALLRGITGDVGENRKEGINYFLIQNFDGKLRIVDWYWEAKETNDVVLRGEYKYSPAYWTKVAEVKSEIRAGERFKITNKELNLGEELALSDEIVIYVLFRNEWSEGQAFSDSDCDFVIDVYENKILYNSGEGVFVDVKNNKSLHLSEVQRNYFNSLLKDYRLMANEKHEGELLS